MVNVVIRGPLWFYGIDAAFELFSFVVLGIILWLSYRAYRLTKDTKYKYFSVAFSALAVAFLSKGVTDVWLSLAFAWRGVPPPSEALEAVGEVFLAGYLVFIFLSLIANVLLVGSTSKVREKRHMVLMALLILVPFYLSSSFSKSFYIISLLLYGFISTHFIQNFLRKKSVSAGCVAAGFSLITIAQGMFLFDILRHKFYVIAHFAQLLGFVLLLLVLVKVLLHGRTKK